MDSRKLLHMKAVVEHGSLRKAAKALGMSQPAVSKSIARLEASLGVRLLERNRDGITPTRLGDILYSHARAIKNTLDLADLQIKRAGDRDSPPLAFGILSSLASNIIPLAVTRWRKDHPTIPIKILESGPLELLTSLLREETDFIITTTDKCLGCDELKQRVLFRDCMRVIARSDHPVFDAEATWADVAKYPWVCPFPEAGRPRLEKLLAPENIEPSTTITECGSVVLIKSLLATSDHLAILPDHVVEADISAGLLRPLPLIHPSFHRSIAVLHAGRSTPSPAGRALINLVKEVGKDACRTTETEALMI